MAVDVTCLHCQKRFKVKDAYIGRRGACPYCKGVIDLSNIARDNRATAPRQPPPIPTRQSSPTSSSPTIAFDCPQCRKALKASAALVGKRVKCSRCATMLRVPGDEKKERPSENTIDPMSPDVLDDFDPASTSLAPMPTPRVAPANRRTSATTLKKIWGGVGSTALVIIVIALKMLSAYDRGVRRQERRERAEAVENRATAVGTATIAGPPARPGPNFGAAGAPQQAAEPVVRMSNACFVREQSGIQLREISFSVDYEQSASANLQMGQVYWVIRSPRSSGSQTLFRHDFSNQGTLQGTMTIFGEEDHGPFETWLEFQPVGPPERYRVSNIVSCQLATALPQPKPPALGTPPTR